MSRDAGQPLFAGRPAELTWANTEGRAWPAWREEEKTGCEGEQQEVTPRGAVPTGAVTCLSGSLEGGEGLRSPWSKGWEQGDLNGLCQTWCQVLTGLPPELLSTLLTSFSHETRAQTGAPVSWGLRLRAVLSAGRWPRGPGRVPAIGLCVHMDHLGSITVQTMTPRPGRDLRLRLSELQVMPLLAADCLCIAVVSVECPGRGPESQAIRQFPEAMLFSSPFLHPTEAPAPHRLG